MQLDAVVAVVLGWHVADDVVVQEGKRALGRSGLWRQHVERIKVAAGWRAREVLVRERHPVLDPIGPDDLIAGCRAGHVSAVPQPCGLGGGSGGQNEGQRCLLYTSDAADEED